MHGVQIHANIIEAYLNDDFVSEMNNIVVVLINSILLFAVCFFAYRRRIVKLSIISLGSVIGLIICQIVLFKLSFYLPILTTLISILIMYIVQIVYQYVYERTIKTKALRAFNAMPLPKFGPDLKSLDFNQNVKAKIFNFCKLWVGLDPLISKINIFANKIFCFSRSVGVADDY